jgi:hypothetical protein
MPTVRFSSPLLAYALLAGATIAAAGYGGCGDDSGTTSGKGGDATGTQNQGGDGVGGKGGSGDEGGGGSSGEGGAGGGSTLCPGGLPVMPIAPQMLSQTGLYANTATKQLAPNVSEFAPQFVLWSDGAVKTRWVYLPPCPVDNTDEDHWQVPVGTRFWKEFVAGKKIGGELVRVETRLIHRYGPGPADFLFVTYQWNEEETDATLVEAFSGVEDANDTNHDIPGASLCSQCHGSLPGHILGFSAIQLSHVGPGETMATLSNAGKLKFPKASGYQVPGNPIERAALGYLHANCGNCHHPAGTGMGIDSMRLRLLTSNTTVESTFTYDTAVDDNTTTFMPGQIKRIDPGNPDNSCIPIRMSVRDGSQMPPIATEVVDTEGLDLIRTWIENMQ